MMTTERRRNQYDGACRVCSTPVAAGAGWLYSDTRSNHARSRHRLRGGWPKFVKCDRCHTLKAVHRNDLPENRPPKVVYQKVGVQDLRRATFRFGLEKYGNWPQPVVRLVLADGESEVVAAPRPITGEFESVADWFTCKWLGGGAGMPVFGLRLLTAAAEKELALLGVLAAAMYEGCDPRDAE